MKIQCLRCKEIVEIGPFVTNNDGIEITCGACAKSFFLAANADSKRTGATESAAPAGSVGAERCPKCDEFVASGLGACQACGLLRERFASFASELAAEADPVLESLWQACLESWAESEAHERFIARASATGAYAPAARRYREMTRTRPGDERATSNLERITKMAEVALLSARPAQVADEGPNAYRGVIIFLVLLLGIGAVAGIYAVTKKKDEPRRVVPVTRPASR